MAVSRGNGMLVLLDDPANASAGPRGRSRMRFEGDEEAAYEVCARALAEDFARWLRKHDRDVDANDAEILLDWRFRYHDGVLDVWTVADVAEFLLSWCPRKLSLSAADSAGIPASVSAFVDFLAHTGRLAPPSDPPSVIRRWCEQQQPRFVREMGEPANFGMAKSILAQAGGLADGQQLTAEDIAALMGRANQLGPAAVGGVLDRVARQAAHVPTEVAAVRLPGDEQYRAAVAATAVLRRVRGLAAYCAQPGVALTQKGNLRVADARALVETLGTDDVVPAGLRSAEHLPRLSRLVEVALAAGAVRRQRGRLVAVAKFGGLDDVAAYEKVLRAGVGLHSFIASDSLMVRQIQEFVRASVPLVLAELLDAGSGGVEDVDLIDLLGNLVVARFPGSARLAELFVPGWTDRIIADLFDLDMVAAWIDDEPCAECDGDHHVIAVTAAGLPTAVELVRAAGIIVPLRPAPATASASDIAELVDGIEPADWGEDARAWFAAQPDPAAAAAELLAAVATPDRATVTVMFTLDEVVEIAGGGPAGHAAVRGLLGGRHDGIALLWLLNHDGLDPREVHPSRLLGGLLDVLAVTMDMAGPAQLVDQFLEVGPADQAELLDNIWRLDHPRLAEILDVLGAGLPDKSTAKRARRCAVKLRTRLGQEQSRARR